MFTNFFVFFKNLRVIFRCLIAVRNSAKTDFPLCLDFFKKKWLVLVSITLTTPKLYFDTEGQTFSPIFASHVFANVAKVQ